MSPGAVLVAMYGSIGKLGIPTVPMATNQAIAFAIPLKNKVTQRYLFWYLRSQREQLASAGKGATQSNISQTILKAWPVPVPPLKGQEQIVEVIEEQFSRLDAGVESFQRAKRNLTRLRSAIARNALGEHNRGTSKRVSLGEMGEMGRGKSRHRPRNAPFLYGGPYPFIQTGDIANSGGLITHHVQTYSEEGLAQSRLWPAGTVCITIAANIAESALLTYPACFPDSVVGIIVDPTVVVPEYLEYFVRTAKANLSAFAPATAQKNINLSILNHVEVGLPTLSAQKEIVAEIQRQFSIIEAVAETIDAGLARAATLRNRSSARRSQAS